MLSFPGAVRLYVKQTVMSCSLILLVAASIFCYQIAQAQGTSTPEKAAKPAAVLGVSVNGPSALPGIAWVRLGYKTCGTGNLSGAALKNAIKSYHSQGMHVLLTYCQPGPKQLFNTRLLKDAAQGRADAVQCGNEEMKYDPGLTNFVPARQFARFFDLCQQAVHAVNRSATIVLGSLDPHVARFDMQQLKSEVRYLNDMQQAMNTQVHKHGHWTWRSQIVGLINSWHDGYPSSYVNNLRDLFSFWASQFRVDLNHLGRHLWVVEDTGCFKGCGLNVKNKKQVAVAHILALITDVQTTIRYHVPFFFFSARDFFASGIYWPIGILNSKGQAKPLRQDLRMGSRSLTLTCGNHKVKVVAQETLLAKLYQGCRLPQGWYYTLTR